MSTAGNVITGANGKLDVYVSKAKDLPNLRKLDKQDPFVKLRIAHLTEISPVVYRGGQTPKFDFHAEFQLTPDIKPLLNVELYDDHDHKNGSKLIGKCDVDLTPAMLSDPEQGHDSWYYLSKGSIDAGKVYIELTFTPNNVGHTRQIETSDLENEILSRPIPPLPSNSPSFAAYSQNSSRKRANDFSLPVNLHERSTITAVDSFSNNNTVFTEYGESPDFGVSVETSYTTNTTNTQQTQSTESLMDKLKLIKEKLNYFRNGSNERTTEVNQNIMDLAALQKVVGGGLESCSSTRLPTVGERESLSNSSSSDPPLPPLPFEASRSSSRSLMRNASKPVTLVDNASPKLPRLPTSPAFSNNSTSGSPTRRPPPPFR